jgi:Ca2+-binding RTX toxin-like protein
MGAPLDYYVDSDFWTFGGNDRLTVHCDASFINMGDGNDRLILTGAWNHIRMGDGNDSVGFISPDMGVTQIGNHFHLGKDDDTAIINGNQNTIVGAEGNDTITIRGKANRVDLGDGNDTLVLNGSSSTIDGGRGADKVTIRGDANRFSSKNNNKGDALSIVGNSNVIDCSSVGFGSIYCAGHDNTIRTNSSKIQIGYQSSGALAQTTSIQGQQNDITWNVSAKLNDGQAEPRQVQKLVISTVSTDRLTIPNNVKLNIHEGAQAHLVSNSWCNFYLTGVVDSNKDKMISPPFYIRIESSDILVIRHNLRDVSVNTQVSNIPDQRVFDFVEDKVTLGRLVVSGDYSFG